MFPCLESVTIKRKCYLLVLLFGSFFFVVYLLISGVCSLQIMKYVFEWWIILKIRTNFSCGFHVRWHFVSFELFSIVAVCLRFTAFTMQLWSCFCYLRYQAESDMGFGTSSYLIHCTWPLFEILLIKYIKYERTGHSKRSFSLNQIYRFRVNSFILYLFINWGFPILFNCDIGIGMFWKTETWFRYLQSIVDMLCLSSICLLRSNTSWAWSLRDLRFSNAFWANAAATGVIPLLKFDLTVFSVALVARSSRIDVKPYRAEEFRRCDVMEIDGDAIVFLNQIILQMNNFPILLRIWLSELKMTLAIDQQKQISTKCHRFDDFTVPSSLSVAVFKTTEANFEYGGIGKWRRNEEMKKSISRFGYKEKRNMIPINIVMPESIFLC